MSAPGCRQERMDDNEKALQVLTSRNLGLAYLEENKLAEAEAEFKKLIGLVPDEAMGYANLGLVYLRMGNVDDAEKSVSKSLSIDPANPDIRLILATIYDISDREDESIEELRTILKSRPDHVKTLFALSDIYAKRNVEGASAEREGYLKAVVQHAPLNLSGRLNLTEVLLDNEKYDEALTQLEEIREEFPVFPGESDSFFKKSVELLKTGKGNEAITPVRIFHNFLKLTSAYQAAVQELKGPRGDLIGFPVITMGEVVTGYVNQGGSILDALKFNDVTAAAGLGPDKFQGSKISYLSMGDIDNDGDQDMFICLSSIQEKGAAGLLFRNDMGTFSDITGSSGIKIQGHAVISAFADYDNDGFLDLFAGTTENSYLYHNEGDGEFTNRTQPSRIDGKKGSRLALFLDYDHDGDLDLLTGNEYGNFLYRNNSDGTFLESSTDAGFKNTNKDTGKAIFGDFDDDGDIDVILANKNSLNIHYSNLREGKFEDISAISGIGMTKNSNGIAAGDYNNDGYLDLFVAGSNGENTGLMLNLKDGNFRKESAESSWQKELDSIRIDAAEFFDFDNDGHEDLLVAGEGRGSNRLKLLHNDGWGKFENLSNLLPDQVTSSSYFTVADFNEDGDLDIFMIDMHGIFHLLRNDGGNANHYIKIRLVGVRTGSSRNNYFGIGSKLELRAGELYQMKLIKEPDIIIGLGDKSSADVVRIQWTNGVAQNIFSPASDQDLVEQQELKGSCPFLYTWDGKSYVFQKDIMWKSALGMPTGIMNGSASYAFPEASLDFIKLDEEKLKPIENLYEIRITSELWETVYTDKINLLAVDHPAGTEIFVDEKFTAPPYPPLKIYTVTKKIIPLTASDGNGNNVLPVLKEKDDVFLSSAEQGRYQGMTDLSYLVLDPGKLPANDSIYLFLQGWIFPTDASVNFALAQNENLEIIPPYLQVLDQKGYWKTVVDNIGFPMGKDKTVITGLTGKFVTGDHKVRIVTNMRIYWDHAFFSAVKTTPVKITWLDPLIADLHYRGFSRMFRKGGRYGPHWFDYDEVNLNPKYLDLTGNYTRYGDVLPLLIKADDMYIISNAGDEITLKFSYADLPLPGPENKRDYLVYSVGWVKDGDLNTATGKTVDPLPFHGMSRYPYGPDESYPSDDEHVRYMKDYNTRYVDGIKFKRALADIKER